MFKLVLKDLRITRVFWLPAAFSYWVFLLLFFEYAWVELAVGIIVTVAMACSFLYIDDMNRTEPLYGALPLRRRDIVSGRYLTTAVIVGMSLVLFFGGTATVRALYGEKAAHLNAFLSVRTALTIAVPVCLLLSIFLPIYFKGGLGKAVIRMIVIVLGTSIALSGLAQLVGRKILGPAAGRETGAARIFLSPPLLLKTLFERVEAALGGTYLALLIIALCLAAMCLSFVLSVRFYRRRDL